MKKGYKFCGFTSLHMDYFEIEVLGKCPGDDGRWEVYAKKPAKGWEKLLRLPDWQIRGLIDNTTPANLDNV